MRRLHRLIKDFFGFSRSQTNGFMVLFPLMAIIIFSEPVYRWWIAHQKRDYTRETHLLDSLIAHWEVDQGVVDTINHQKAPLLFSFDPNTISREDLQLLGFQFSLANRIVNYRDKGGRFRVKSDLLRMYGIDTSLYYKLQPYIQLPATLEKEPLIAKVEIPRKSNREAFDINMADTITLESIYGIGVKLSKRIIKYREKLGGFTSMAQLNEIWGLDSTVINQLAKRSFIAPNYVPLQLNINQATEIELSAHPYLSRNTAKAIVAYRFQHGPFNHIEDLGKIEALDINTIQKITPYLKFQR